jgi:hypothetical protein
MSAHLTKTMFEQNLNSRFWLRRSDGQRTPLDLVEFEDGRSFPPYEQFSLLFRGDKNELRPQDNYPIAHDAMGEFDLFLVPVERNDQGTFYQAVFNRLASGTQN